MDPLSFIAKIIGSTARIGTTIALGALAVAILRWMNVEPLKSIDNATYGYIVAAGIIGFCAVVVAIPIAIGSAIREVILAGLPLLSETIERRRTRKTALKNMQLQPDVATTLRYLKAHNLKRFQAPAPERNRLLQRMSQSFLIEIDDPNYERFGNAIYNVPEYVWRWIARAEPDH
jgi:hypothetical protein